MIARAMGKLHADELLWQDPRGRMCIRGSAFAAKQPTRRGGGGGGGGAISAIKTLGASVTCRSPYCHMNVKR